MEKFPITKEGYVYLEAEIKRLKSVERPAIIEAIAEARAHGDLSENAEYHTAKDRQGFIESQIIQLEDKYTRAQIIDVSKLEGDRVMFGATVTLADEDTDEEKRYQIVSEVEADLENGRVSLTSPIARALIGKEEGDSIEVSAPGGARGYEILKVEFI